MIRQAVNRSLMNSSTKLKSFNKLLIKKSIINKTKSVIAIIPKREMIAKEQIIY
jgi:hypothetical protein